MNDTVALIIRDDHNRAIAFTSQAVALKREALEAGALVGKVTNAEQQVEAVNAQTILDGLIKMVEKARKAAKEPVIEFGRKIDDQAKSFVAEISTECMRIARLIGDFQALEQARVRAEQQAQNERLLAIERERAAEAAKATTHKQLEAVAEKFDDKIRAQARPIEPVRVEGQRVTTDWEITVTNEFDLAKFHPNCVKIAPRLTEIKELLGSGFQVRAVKAEKVTKAGIRQAPQRTIE